MRFCQRIIAGLLAGGLLLGLAGPVAAQTTPVLLPASAYRFTASTGTYVSPPINGFVRDIQQDGNDSRPVFIGFAFPFEDRAYTQFIVSSEGWLSFGGNPNGSQNDLGVPGGAVLAPFWDDLNGNMGQASYSLQGTAPNRVFTMEWQSWRWPNNGSVAGVPNSDVTTISFQVKLYETTGVIQYCYRREAAVPYPAFNLGASIGLMGYGGFLSLNNASAAPTASSTVSTNTIVQRPATGQIYTFTPPTPCPALTGATAAATGFTTGTVGFGTVSGSRYSVSYGVNRTGATLQTVAATTSPVALTGLQPNTEYQVEVRSLCANGAVSLPVTVTFTTPAMPNPTARWTGAVSRDWATAANWNPAAVPTATTDVTVPPVANQPIVATAAQTCSALALQAGASLTLAAGTGPVPTYFATAGTVTLASGSTLTQAAGTTLAVGGDLRNNGATLALDPLSTVAFEGGSGHVLGGTALTALQNLTLGATSPADQLEIQAPVSVQRLLSVQQSSFVDVTASAGGTLRLLSNAQGTAQVVHENIGVGGPVTVERSLPASTAGGVAGVGRHYYSTPVQSRPLAGLAAPGFGPVVNAAYNSSATPAATTPFPTVFAYDQGRISTNVDGLADFETGFYSPTALTEAMLGGVGYRLDVPGAVTLAVTGTLRQTNALRTLLTRATLPQSGYHLVGNPYAATIIWDSVRLARGTTGLDAAVYVYQSAGAGAGTFRAYVNGVGSVRYLPPGQAFFVRVSGPSVPGNVAITSAARYSGYYDPAAPPAAAPDARPLVQLTLAGASGPIDEATAYFEAGATAGFDRLFDAQKLPTGGAPWVAFAGTAPLAISGLPALTGADVRLPLAVQVPATGSYTLAAARLRNLPAGTYAYLQDAQTGRAVDLNVQPGYAFTMNAAFAGPRFTLLLTRTVLATVSAALAAQVLLYPNPAHGVAQLELPAALHRQAVTAVVVDAVGQVVRTLVLPAGPGLRALALAGLAPGAYTVQLRTPQGTVAKRLLLE